MLRVAMLSKWHVHAEGYARDFIKTEKAPGLVLLVLVMIILYYFLLRIFHCIKKSDLLLAKQIFKKDM